MTNKKMTKKKATKKTNKTPDLKKLVKEEVEAQIPKIDTGMVVALPNTTAEKMKAISDLAASIKSLAKSIESTNVELNIRDCNFQNHNTAIRFAPKI
jgi:hypothetical protein